MLRNIIASVFILLLACQGLAAGRDDGPRRRVEKEETARAATRPDLGVESSQAARLKVVTRKTSYRVGEMIDLHLALLNAGEEPVYFYELSRPALYVSFEGEAERRIYGYIITMKAVQPDEFTLLGPKLMMTGTYQALAGCKPSAEVAAAWAGAGPYVDDGHDLIEFEKGAFASYGSTCLPFERPGTYTIRAEHENHHVVVTGRKSNPKTAVGTLRAAPIKITVAAADCQ